MKRLMSQILEELRNATVDEAKADFAMTNLFVPEHVLYAMRCSKRLAIGRHRTRHRKFTFHKQTP